jgi:hypothetical protein
MQILLQNGFICLDSFLIVYGRSGPKYSKTCLKRNLKGQEHFSVEARFPFNQGITMVVTDLKIFPFNKGFV